MPQLAIYRRVGATRSVIGVKLPERSLVPEAFTKKPCQQPCIGSTNRDFSSPSSSSISRPDDLGGDSSNVTTAGNHAPSMGCACLTFDAMQMAESTPKDVLSGTSCSSPFQVPPHGTIHQPRKVHGGFACASFRSSSSQPLGR
jgi:hypothetical protein